MQLVNDYQVLCQSRLVLTNVAEPLKMSPNESANLSGMISVRTKSNTRHLTINVTDTNPDRAALIANTVAGVFAKVVVENMGTGMVKIIDQAVAPERPSSPNVKRNLVSGALLGLLFGGGLALLI